VTTKLKYFTKWHFYLSNIPPLDNHLRFHYAINEQKRNAYVVIKRFVPYKILNEKNEIAKLNTRDCIKTTDYIFEMVPSQNHNFL